MGLNLKKFFGGLEEPNSVEEQFYNESDESEKSKMVLIEPRAFSESQTIADHLKNRRSVVVNLKRVTSDNAKRIIDFLSGCVYAIGGDLQKIGGGTFLCTPKMVSVEGEITEPESKDNNDDIETDW